MHKINKNCLSNYQKKNYPIPQTDSIIEPILSEITANMTPHDIKQQFDDIVTETERRAHQQYRIEERNSIVRTIKAYFSELKEKNNIVDCEELINIIAEHSEAFDALFLSISQSRKARAGKAFEYIITFLFKKLDYPFTYRPTINGEPDFIIPSEQHFRRFPADCIVFTAKRTIRERWRQIVTEPSRGFRFFLATIDENVSRNQLGQMRENRIFLVVPRNIKIKKYNDDINVISFQEFFFYHLDKDISRWRNAGII